MNKFSLESIAAKVAGGVTPPFVNNFYTPVAGRFNEIQYPDVTRLDDEELVATLRTNALGIPMIFPLRLAIPGQDFWMLPLEPLISVTGHNIIVKRNVAKSKKRGSIKAYWTQDDYVLTIEGMLMDLNDYDKYPADDVRKLRELCESKTALNVECPLLELYDIAQIVIEDYDMPFTKGANTQAYSIKAYSDDLYELLIKDTLQK